MKEVEKAIELGLKRDCDKMKTGQKQTELFFPQFKFKVRLYVSSFSQKIKGREYHTYSPYVLPSFWLPSMESSIWFWTNFLLKMMSPYMLIIGTEMSVRTHFSPPSFIDIIPFATLLDMKVGKGGIRIWAPTYQAGCIIFHYTNFLIKSGFLIHSLTTSESPTMSPDTHILIFFTLTHTSSIPAL